MGSSAFGQLPNCAGTKVDGGPCRSKATGQGAYCLAHDPDPERRAKFKAIRLAGAKRSKVRFVSTPSAQDIARSKNETLGELAEGLITDAEARKKMWLLNQFSAGELAQRRARQATKLATKRVGQELSPAAMIGWLWRCGISPVLTERAFHRLARLDAFGRSTERAITAYLTGEVLEDGQILGRDVDTWTWLAAVVDVEPERLVAIMASWDAGWLRAAAPSASIEWADYAPPRVVAGAAAGFEPRQDGADYVVWAPMPGE